MVSFTGVVGFTHLLYQQAVTSAGIFNKVCGMQIDYAEFCELLRNS